VQAHGGIELGEDSHILDSAVRTLSEVFFDKVSPNLMIGGVESTRDFGSSLIKTEAALLSAYIVFAKFIFEGIQMDVFLLLLPSIFFLVSLVSSAFVMAPTHLIGAPWEPEDVAIMYAEFVKKKAKAVNISLFFLILGIVAMNFVLLLGVYLG
jgi:hypothetical protein